MRVLPDVNILVRANEKSSGPARKLLLNLISHGHSILTSAEILIELAQVLVCEIILIDQIHHAPIRDLSDTSVLRTAIAGEADYICTVDKDFYTEEITAFCATLGIAVLDDVALLRRLTG